MKNALQQDKGSTRLNLYLLTPATLLLFLSIWIVFINPDNTADNKVFEWIAPWINDASTSWMKAITFLGNHKFLIPANLALIAVLLLLKKGNLAWRLALVALSSLGLKFGLKELFERPRPVDPLVQGITNFSFPSGHALMGVAFYGFLIWLAAKYIREKTVKTTTVIFLSLLILLISFSRIYLRVHYTTDVVAGLCIGICWTWFCLWLTNKIEPVSGFKPEH